MSNAEGSSNSKYLKASASQNLPGSAFGNSVFVILSSFVIWILEFIRVGRTRLVRYVGRSMSPTISAAGAEFLENYQRDVSSRWSSADLAAQQEFVNAQIAGRL